MIKTYTPILEYEIIHNSDTNQGFDIADDKFYGYIRGLCCGWQYEYADKDGNLSYSSVSFLNVTPANYALMFIDDITNGEWIHDTARYHHGLEPTGRVVFRGYAEEHYDSYYRETFVTRIDHEVIEKMLGDRPEIDRIGVEIPFIS